MPSSSHSPSQFVQSDSSVREVSVLESRFGHITHKRDQVAEEVPVALVYNGISHAVMLATPQDLEDFALGFSLTEGIARQVSDIYAIETRPSALGISLDIQLANAAFVNLKQKRRNLTGRTGCGLCGSESLEQALRFPIPCSQLQPMMLSRSALERAFNNIRSNQPLQALTGATHACAWVNLSGDIVLVREDVGRHNALDKLVGALAQATQRMAGFVLTTSRASVEMVQKALHVASPVLAAISAPSALAIRVADSYGMTLLGFVREHSFVVYTHPQRLVVPEETSTPF